MDPIRWKYTKHYWMFASQGIFCVGLAVLAYAYWGWVWAASATLLAVFNLCNAIGVAFDWKKEEEARRVSR